MLLSFSKNARIFCELFIWIQALGFLGFVVSQLTSIFPPSVHFCEFPSGPHNPPKRAAGLSAPLHHEICPKQPCS